MLTIGAILAAFSIEEFLAPNNIYDGGIVGISMIIDYYIPLRLSHIIVILSVPFVIFGIKRLGKGFVIKFIYATILFSVMTEVFAPFANATREKILAEIFELKSIIKSVPGSTFTTKEHILRRLTGVVATLFTAAFVTVSLPGMINEVYAYDINNKAITGLGAGAISNPDPKQPGSWCYVYYGRENGMERK